MVKSGFVTMEAINKRKRSVEKIIGERFALKDACRRHIVFIVILLRLFGILPYMYRAESRY